MQQNPLPDPSSRVRHIWGIVCGLVACFILAGSLLVANCGQMLSVLFIPFSKKTFREANRWLSDAWCGLVGTVARGFYGTKLIITGEAIPNAENAIVIINHQEMADITYMWMYARQKERLGDLKWFVKNVLKYVPGVGWGMLFLDCLFVKRDWTKDRDSIEQTFSTINDEKLPFWLMLFAEGTRFNHEKVPKSQEIARKKGVEPFQHVLFPRPKGFTSSVQGLRDNIKAVYDITIGYYDGIPTLWQYLKGTHTTAHIHVRRFPMAELPEEPEELNRWLIDRYREKDALLEEFFVNKAFPS